MLKRISLKIISLLLFSSMALQCYGIDVSKEQVSENKAVAAFIQKMAKKHHFEQKSLAVLFDQVQLRQDIIHSIKKPKEALPWYRYRPIFVTKKRASKGIEFWRKHQKALSTAEAKYGVPAHVIVAILGVESFYGRFKGKFRVIDSLTTLAFYYPSRSRFFRSELEQFLLLTQELKLNPLEIYGSYAGAMGPPQFMPSSYRRYAASLNGSKSIDIINNTDDMIASVANYLSKHGWQTQQPIAVRAKQVQKTKLPKLNQPFPLPALSKIGIKPLQEVGNTNTKAELVSMKQRLHSELWLGFKNFKVIKSYNPRDNYAMAVFQLSELIQSMNKPKT